MIGTKRREVDSIPHTPNVVANRRPRTPRRRRPWVKAQAPEKGGGKKKRLRAATIGPKRRPTADASPSGVLCWSATNFPSASMVASLPFSAQACSTDFSAGRLRYLLLRPPPGRPTSAPSQSRANWQSPSDHEPPAGQPPPGLCGCARLLRGWSSSSARPIFVLTPMRPAGGGGGGGLSSGANAFLRVCVACRGQPGRAWSPGRSAMRAAGTPTTGQLRCLQRPSGFVLPLGQPAGSGTAPPRHQRSGTPRSKRACRFFSRTRSTA